MNFLKSTTARIALAALLGMVAIAPAAFAAPTTSTFQILLDLDNHQNTGCDVPALTGTFKGVEQILITTVTAGGPVTQVTAVQVRNCVSGTTFGPPSAVPAPAGHPLPWNIGVGNGTGGTEVIETYLPLSLVTVNPLHVVQVGVLAFDSGNVLRDELLKAQPTPGNGPPILLNAALALADIPTLSEWGLMLLGLTLAGAAVAVLRRRRTAASVMLALLLLGSAGLAWGAVISCDLNGNTTAEWIGGTQLAVEPSSDAPVGTDMRALFGFKDGTLNALVFRIDADLPAPTFNQPPVVNPATFSIPENSPNGTNVGTVTFTDPDVGQSHTFSITAGNPAGAFAINPTTGQITVANSAALNFEVTPVFNLTVQVTDNGSPVASGSGTVTVNLTDVNEAPVVNPATFAVPEGSPNGTSVGTVTFTDPDVGQTHTCSITAGNTGGAFAINSSTCQITVADSTQINFATTPTYSLTVQVTDNGSPVLSGTGTVTVNVTDTNDAPVVNPATFSVPEGSPNGTSVGTVTFTDPDTGQTHTFAITAGNTGGAFAINPSTGQITVATASALDFETTPTYSLTVQVTDNGTPALSGTATITINLTDANDAPVVNPATFSLPENSPNGTNVGTPVTFTDQDTGQTHTFAITAGNPGGAFAIDPSTGQITVANSAALDFETTPTFSLTVQVTDNGTPALSGTATVTVNLTDVNEAPVVNPTAFGVAEHAPNGTNVGTPVTFTDPDAGQTHTFAITAGNTGGAFAINAATGQITVANSAALDFATNPTFSLTVQVTDNGTPALSGSATVTINIGDVNDPPVVNPATFSLPENSPNGTNVGTVTFSDPDGGQTHTFAITAGNTGGAFAINPSTGQITVANSAALDFETTPTFSLTVQVTDNGAPVLSGTATVTVNLTNVDESPVIDLDANDDKGTTGSDFAVTFKEGDPATLIEDPADATLTDVDSATLASLTVTITNLLDPGSEILSTDLTGTSITGNYVPATGVLTLTGPDTVANFQTVLRKVKYQDTDVDPDTTPRVIHFVANDGTSNSNTATSTVTIMATDTPPTAVADSATVAEDSSNNPIDVLANDTDPDNGPKSVASVTQPANGTVVITGGGTGVSYTPNANYCNTPPGTTLDTFTYTLTPGSSSTTVTVTVTCVDDNPTAVADAATVTEDAPATAIDVLANDTDPDGGPKSIASVTQPANGTVVITGGGTGLTYQPHADYCNSPSGTPDTFTYTLAPGGSSATVSVTVTCVDDNPTAVADTATVVEDSGANAIPVLANDTDPDGGPKSIASVTQPANGVVVITGAGTGLTYAPNANYCNTPPGTTLDTFTYTLTPGSSSTTVTVTVTCVDDAPVAVADAATVTEDSGANAIPVLANDTDVDGGPKSIASVTQPANGTVVITGGGTGLTYAPNANYCNNPPGTTLDTFTYTLTPGSSSTTVTVTVTCVDDAPVAVADAATVNEDSGANAIPVLANDTDVDGGPKSINSVTQPANGVVVITGGGTGLTYAPNANYCNNPPGTTLDTFTYTLTPGSSSTTVTVTVTCVDDNPVAVADAATVTEDSGANAIPVLANDTDIDGGPKSIASVTQPANGVVVITGGGTGLTYAPNANYCNNPPGTTLDTFTYTLTPGSSSTTVTVTVTCVDDPPVAVADAATVLEDSGANAIPVLANDTDVDAGPKSVSSVTQPANGVVVITGGGTGLTYAPNANYCNNPPGTTLDTFTYTLAPGSSSTTVTVTVTCVNDAPVLANPTITYTTPGNTQLHVAGATRPGVASVSDAQGVLAKSNPSDVDGPGPLQVVAATGTSANGGSFTISADGSFSYVPAAGFTGTDTFTFQVTDNGSPAATATGTVSITVGQRVWYIRDVVDANNAAGGDGRSTNAFDSIAAFNAATTNNGDIIFIFRGNTGTTPLSGGIVLKDGQKLWGEGIGLTVPGFGTLVPAGAKPKINNTGGDAVSVPATAGSRQNVEIRGLDLQASGNAVDVTASGANNVGITISDNDVTGAGLEGYDLNAGSTGTFAATLNNNAINATGNAFDARTSAATTMTVAFSNNAVNSGATGILIDGSGGGTTTITGFANNAVSQNNVGTGIAITSARFDATPTGSYQTVSGGTTVVGASGNGVGASGVVMTGVSGDLAFTDLDIFADGGAALRITGTGAVNTGAGTGTRVTVGAGVAIFEATGGPAVDVTNATIDLQPTSIKSTNSTSTGVSLDTVTGTFAAGSGSAISNATGTSFNVNAGTATISYDGTITNSTGRSVSVTSKTSGSTTFNGTITATGGTGIFLNGNTGSTISFTKQISLSTGANDAFTATGGGTVTATDTTSTLTTTTGVALNVANTTIGAGGLKFQSISAGTAASGPANGIVLNNTGASGGLTVSGTGSAGSGGTIRKGGTGISLTNTRNVSLSYMQLNDFTDYAIRGASVVNFSMVNTIINGVNGDNAAANEGSVRFTELTGTATISNSNISGSVEDTFSVVNTTGTLNRITFTNDTFGANATTTGDNGLLLEAQSSAVLNATIQNSFFTSARGDLVQATITSGATGSMDVVFTGNTLSDNHPAIVAGGGGTLFGGVGGTFTYNIASNTFRDATGDALVMSCGGTGSSCVGRIENNQIGLAGTANSGSTGGSGIALVSAAGGTFTSLVNNNTVRQYNNTGIRLQAGDQMGNPLSFNATVTNNTVGNPGSINTNFNGIQLNNGTVSTDNFTSCVDIRGNSVANSGSGSTPPNNADVRLRQRQSTTVRLPGYAGANNNDAAVVAFLTGNNTLSTAASSNTVPTGGGYVGGAACPTPP